MATGFTVTELLIVVGIIILAMALAVPALNLITGNKSTEAATNLISSLLARARDDAIGLQEIRGVMFYYDPIEDRVNAALVEEVDPPTSNAVQLDVYLDLVDGADHLTLPKGISLQTVDDGGGGTIPTNDRYIGFNTKNNNASGVSQTVIPYGGVLLFDSRGLLVSKSYVLQVQHVNPTTSALFPQGYWEYTHLGVLFCDCDPTAQSKHSEPLGDAPLPKLDIVPVDPSSSNITNGKILRSQVGFVVFESDQFKNAGYTADDLQVANTGSLYSASTEQTEETWLDSNAVPLLINRYNGTLVKGE